MTTVTIVLGVWFAASFGSFTAVLTTNMLVTGVRRRRAERTTVVAEVAEALSLV